MKKIKVGIVGGCLAGLGNVKKSELFYSRLKSELNEKLDISFSLEGYSNIEEVKGKIHKIISRRKIDYLLFQLRPAPYIRACRFFLRMPRYQLNPVIFGGSGFDKFDMLRMPTEKKDEFVGSINDNNYSVIRKYFSMFNLNVALGYFFGVHKHVEKYYARQIVQLHQYCASLGIVMLVHGPVPRTSLGMANVLLKSLASTLECVLQPDVCYVSTFELDYEGENVLFGDGGHVNANGHKMIADRVLPAFTALVHK